MILSGKIIAQFIQQSSKVCIKQNTLNNVRFYSKEINPFTKTWSVLSQEIPAFFGRNKKPNVYPEHADIVIIGGGFIGSSVAYWLKTKAGNGLSVVVLEKDFSFKEAQRNTSLGILTQHFSLPENVLLSQYAAEFLRNIKSNLNSDIDIQYYPCGHLILASEKYADRLEQNVAVLREHGVQSKLLTPSDVNKQYPWINTKDVELACIGTESEGYFNSWTLLKGLVQRSKELGTNYVNAEVTGFKLELQRDVLMEGVKTGTFNKINRIVYTTPDNEEHEIKFAACILAAGTQSRKIAEYAQIGSGDGLLSVPLPIETKKTKLFSIENHPETGLNTPVIMDTSGLWLRKNGLESNLLCGHIPFLTVDTNNMPEKEYLDTIISPALTNRIPGVDSVKVNIYNEEEYDCNIFDDTGILGAHPYHNNMQLATGFGRYGCAHASGVGRAIAELLIDSQFTTIDLTRFGFDRLLTSEPTVEFNVY